MSEFDRVLPPLATLVVFEAAHRLGSFTRAAGELHLSQASVSRRVRELEDDLGLPLFERHRYDVRPTAAGDEFAASVRLALGELASTAARLRRPRDQADGFTVLSSLSFASEFVAPALATLQRRHPDLRIRLVSACAPIETTTERFDVAVQYGPPTSRRFDVTPIASEAIVPVCSLAVRATLPERPSVTDLAGLRLLDAESDDGSWMTWSGFLEAVAGAPCDPVDRTEFSSYAVTLDVAERGEGVALGWAHSIGARLESGRLVALESLRLPAAVDIHAYVPSSAAPNPLVGEWLTLVREAADRVERAAAADV